MSEEDAKSTKTKASEKTTRHSATPAAEPAEEDTKPVVEEEGGFKEFIWNPDTKEFLGRTGKSWLDITIFYIIFFISLYCFFMLSWYVTLLVVDPFQPKQQGSPKEAPGIGAILYRKGPGLSIRPVPDGKSNGVSTLIWFRTGTGDGHNFWSGQLRKWINSIPEKKGAVTDKCTYKSYLDGEACFVDKTIYKECDGGDPTFGYDRGEPCILLKINRIYNWVPATFSKDEISKLGASIKACAYTIEDKCEDGTDVDVPLPTDLKKYMTNNFKEAIYIWCEGDHDHDKENLGPIEYFPGPYIEKKYFPYLNQKNYQSPFVMMKLKRPMPGALISIICTAFAKNIKQDKETQVGYMKFQLLIGG